VHTVCVQRGVVHIVCGVGHPRPLSIELGKWIRTSRLAIENSLSGEQDKEKELQLEQIDADPCAGG